MIQEVGSGIIRQFSERLTAQITAGGVPSETGDSSESADRETGTSGFANAGAAAAGRPAARPATTEPDSSALDLASLIPPELKSRASIALAALAGLAIGVLAARRGVRGGRSWPGGQPAVFVVHLRQSE